MKTKRKVPAGYDDEASFVKEAVERWTEATDFDKQNRDDGIEDIKFMAGEQWDKLALESRTGKPCLSLNTLPPFVAQVVGDIRINKPAIRVRPAEDGDQELADIREGLIRAIERDNDAQGVYSTTGENQVTCGIGNARVGLKYASDASFDRDITIEAIPDPFAVVWDPLSTERTGRDAQYCFVQNDMPRKAFEKQFKDSIPSELTIPTASVDGWFTSDIVKVTEYWLMKETEVEIALLEGGIVCDIDKVPPGAVPLKTRKAIRRSACMYLITSIAVLAGPFELPIDRLPIIRARGWEMTLPTKRIRWGLVRFAKDAARLKNYWRSVQAEKLALAPRQQWLIHEQQEGANEAFRNAAESGDTVLSWSGTVPPQRLDPPQIEAALLQAADQNSQDIKDVTGIHDASLGAQSNETSGKAILARERQGDVATYIYHDNLHAMIREVGRIVEKLIDVVFDTARTIRVVGEDDAVKVKRINDPNDPKSIDLNRGRYDVVVETGPSYSTKRQEAAESMEAFFQVVPQAAQLAGDLYAQAQDWPMGDEFARRLKKALPPGVADDEEDDSPQAQEARAAAQQQAQQQAAIQERVVQMGLAEQQAKVKTAEANAVKAQAEAIEASLNVDQGETATILAEMFGDNAANAFLAIYAARKLAAETPEGEGGQGGQLAA